MSANPEIFTDESLKHFNDVGLFGEGVDIDVASREGAQEALVERPVDLVVAPVSSAIRIVPSVRQETTVSGEGAAAMEETGIDAVSSVQQDISGEGVAAAGAAEEGEGVPPVQQDLAASSEGAAAAGASGEGEGVSSVQQDPTAFNVIKLMLEMELDKTNLDNFINTVMPEPRPCAQKSMDEWIKIVREAPKFQHNPLEASSLGHNQLCVTTAPPQSAKTGVLVALIMLMAVMMSEPMPTILFTQLKTNDLGRFVGAIDDFNKLFKKCAGAVGFLDPPTLKALRSDARGITRKFGDALVAWKNGGKEIPVYLAMQSHAGVRDAKPIMEKIDYEIGRLPDDTGRIRVFVGIDEGDLCQKGKGTTKWDTELRKAFRKDSFGPKTLLDVASSVAFVTATPQALVTTALPLDGREFIYTDLPVSKNYCGYGDGLVQPVGFKTIRRIEVEGKDETGRGVRQQFYDYVAESDKPIAGMVYTNGDTEGSVDARIKEARETAVAYRDIFRFLTCSWSAGKLDIFTSLRDLQTAIENIQVRNGKNVLVKGFVKIGPENQGVVHYKWKGITDYPRFVTAVMEALREVSPNNGFFKSILFGREMVARGVPVCGTNHMRHLDCALIIMPGASCENVIQIFGRVCAVIEASVSSKMDLVVFGPKSTHHIHRKALATTNFCSRAFGIMADGGPSALEKLESMRREALEGNLVEDVDGIIEFFKTRLTRPGPQRGAKRIATQIEKLQRENKKQRKNEMEGTGAPEDPLERSDEPGTGDAGERDAQPVDSMEVELASVEGVLASV